MLLIKLCLTVCFYDCWVLVDFCDFFEGKVSLYPVYFLVFIYKTKIWLCQEVDRLRSQIFLIFSLAWDIIDLIVKLYISSIFAWRQLIFRLLVSRILIDHILIPKDNFSKILTLSLISEIFWWLQENLEHENLRSSNFLSGSSKPSSKLSFIRWRIWLSFQMQRFRDIEKKLDRFFRIMNSFIRCLHRKILSIRFCSMRCHLPRLGKNMRQ